MVEGVVVIESVRPRSRESGGLDGTLVWVWLVVWVAVVFLGLDGTSSQRVVF